MRKLTFSLILLFLLGIAVAGATVVTFLLTSPEMRNTHFWISFGTLAFCTVLSFGYGILQVIAGDERIAPLPSLFSLGTMICFYDLFVLAAVLVTRSWTLSVPAYVALHVGGAVLFLVLGGFLSMVVLSTGRNDEEARRSRLHLADLATKADQAAEAFSRGGETGSFAARLRALSEALRYSDPMSHPSLAAEEERLANLLETLHQSGAGSSGGGGEPQEGERLLSEAERLLKERNARLLRLK